MQAFKKLVVGMLVALLLAGGSFVKGPQAAAGSGQGGGGEAQVAAGAPGKERVILEVDAPPVLRRLVPFPVAVVVTNAGAKGQDLVLEELQVQDADHPQRLRTRLAVGARLEGVGRDLEEFEKLRERVREAREQGTESGVNPEEVREKGRRLERGRKIIKVTVDPQQYADEFKPGEALRLTINVPPGSYVRA